MNITIDEAILSARKVMQYLIDRKQYDMARFVEIVWRELIRERTSATRSGNERAA